MNMFFFSQQNVKMKLCAPAIIYLTFSLIQIIIELFKGLYNTAFLKFIVMIMLTLLLNILCESGLGIVSWFIVFIPFILMTVITSLLLYIFGLNATKGTTTCEKPQTDKKKIVIIAPQDINSHEYVKSFF
jgi:predicted membrane metal-binding protein